MTSNVVLLNANALNLPLADSSVDLIVTSPPYFALRSYQDGGEHYEGQLGAEATPIEFIDALIMATTEIVRVLKPSGSIFVNLGDKYSRGSRPLAQAKQSLDKKISDSANLKYSQNKSAENSGITGKSLMGIPWRYALRCIDDLGLILRAEIIWAKTNGMPESVTDRVTRKHEQWFHFTKSESYYSNIDAIREPYIAAPAKAQKSKVTTSKQGSNPTLLLEKDLEHNPLGKMPGSWWAIPTQPLKVPEDLGIEHFAAFPTEWPRRLILGWSPPGAVVLDPFGGTGTTAAVAKALGRTGISVDLSSDYLRLADWRCNGDGYSTIYSKAHGTETITRPMAGQGALEI